MLSGALLLLIAASLVRSAVRDKRFEWGVIWQYLFDPRILSGLEKTLMLTVAAMVLASVVGLMLALMRQSQNPVMKWFAGTYIWAFRGTPVLVQLLIWYNLAALYPTITLGVPFGPALIHANANKLITVWIAALLGLALNEGAYLAEIIRAGITAVDRGQVEAAHSLGMGGTLAFRRVVLPQALRVIVPPFANETIGLLKYSSVVSVITLPELLYSGQLIYEQSYQVIPILLVVSIWYLVVTSVLTVIEMIVERRLGAGWAPQVETSPRKSGRWQGWMNLGR
jgi:polar amino acid transport system permease protein